jgi:hypothetical protein
MAKRIRYENTNTAWRDGEVADRFEMGGRPYDFRVLLQSSGSSWLDPGSDRFLTAHGELGMNPYVFGGDSGPNVKPGDQRAWLKSSAQESGESAVGWLYDTIGGDTTGRGEAITLYSGHWAAGDQLLNPINPAELVEGILPRYPFELREYMVEILS